MLLKHLPAEHLRLLKRLVLWNQWIHSWFQSVSASGSHQHTRINMQKPLLDESILYKQLCLSIATYGISLLHHCSFGWLTAIQQLSFGGFHWSIKVDESAKKMHWALSDVSFHRIPAIWDDKGRGSPVAISIDQ